MNCIFIEGKAELRMSSEFCDVHKELFKLPFHQKGSTHRTRESYIVMHYEYLKVD